ncbi:MAG: hypothetical protein ABI430_01505 [Candidatus Taylorbacteria bacterium]
MEKPKFEEYRDDLAKKLEDIRNADKDNPEIAKSKAEGYLEAIKTAKEYQTSREKHIRHRPKIKQSPEVSEPKEKRSEISAELPKEEKDMPKEFPGKMTEGEKGLINVLRIHNSEKLALYDTFLKILKRHSGFTESFARFLFESKLSAEDLSPFLDTLFTRLEISATDPNRRGAFISGYLRDIKKKHLKRAAIVRTDDPRYSKHMRASSEARRVGHHHKKGGHT